MGFQYEWWNVEIIQGVDVRVTIEVKAKSKAQAVKQIERMVKESNSEKNAARPLWERMVPISEVLWETMTLDRTGYQRRF